MTDFKNDAANASEKYSDKVIAVTGQVGTIQDEYVTCGLMMTTCGCIM